jgi:7-cyano-7-deazaguanine tRNA-ribosyltransferase
MQIVAGLSVKNFHPRVWDQTSPYYLPNLQAVMVSYAEFHQLPTRRRQAMEHGLHAYLGVPAGTRIYLDNGAFYFLRRGGETARHEYDEFVAHARPDWYPIPQDYIPSPAMTLDEQRHCLERTMQVNLDYQHDGYVPVIHISQIIEESIVALQAHPRLFAKQEIALGGIVPNLLRMPKARPYREVLNGVKQVRRAFVDKRLHLYGVGGTATLHLAALLEMNSVDSSGWRNRAARGIVQLPGSGDRLIAPLGTWRGRVPSDGEWNKLAACVCPACVAYGRAGLQASGTHGFANRATHNLFTLLEEARWIQERLTARTYANDYLAHLDNSIYRPLIEETLAASDIQYRNVETAAPRCDTNPPRWHRTR